MSAYDWHLESEKMWDVAEDFNNYKAYFANPNKTYIYILNNFAKVPDSYSNNLIAVFFEKLF